MVTVSAEERRRPCTSWFILRILDPEKFISITQAELGQLPLGLKLLVSISSMDGTRATCLWAAASIDTVKGYLESKEGAVRKNEYPGRPEQGVQDRQVGLPSARRCLQTAVLKLRVVSGRSSV